MINRTQLLADLQTVLRRLEADLLERSEEMAPVKEVLRGEHQRARTAERTAQSYDEWRSDYITQIAAAWILSCVFVRFVEDNRLVDPPRVAGPGERLSRARDEHELYFRAHPTETDREYLLHVFDELARLPGAKDIFGEHNPIHELPTWLSGDAAGALLTFFQRIDANTGVLVHNFTDPAWNTRFLGDLYQDLSEAARKKYALLQTPEFVEEFILDRTLDPAIEEFGLEGLRMIDPACGSGHFLLGSFVRLLDRWLRKEPGTNIRKLVQRALNSVHGVDVNPYAVAIARFRLLLGAMKACEARRLADAPAFHLNLACGDSLIHGSVKAVQQYLGDWSPIHHVYHCEDLPELQQILQPGRYHAVVANPPYITPKDRALNQAYRDRYSTCYREYPLAVPFMQRLFDLAIRGQSGQTAGYVGQITANSFMNNEFGKKLVEEFFPYVHLTHVIDTRYVKIPGHSTPTVILFGRHCRPDSGPVRTVMGIKGETSAPDSPSGRTVWSNIVRQVELPGSESAFFTVADIPRENLYTHPWSIGGGGVADLMQRIDDTNPQRLGNLTTDIGFICITKADDVFAQPFHVFARTRVERNFTRPFGAGEEIRDWQQASGEAVIYPYDESIKTISLNEIPWIERFMWPYRTNLFDRKVFGGQTYRDIDKPWYEYGQIPVERSKIRLSVVYAYKASHNHFVLDRNGKVFKQTAPVIKLPAGSKEDQHLAILGLLNSSTACFWEREVHRSVSGHGQEEWQVRLERNGTKLQQFPLPDELPLELAQRLDELAQLLRGMSPDHILGRMLCDMASLRENLNTAKDQWHTLRLRMISLQEELDWQCYRLYGLIDENLIYGSNLPPIQLGQRAFEIVIARRMAAGEMETTWFDRHGSIPIIQIPAEWPEDYRKLVERRIELIETDHNISLIEQPEYKRRWNTEPWESQLERTLSNWLLNYLESYFDFDGRMNDADTPTAKFDITLTSTARLADVARQDGAFMQVGELYRNDPAFDIHRLVAELVEAESVPLLPVLRYKDSGRRKWREWEQTWDLQRQEDAIDARTRLSKDNPQYLTDLQAQALKRREIGDIPVPPKYTSSDFASSTYWRLRGKLDVPKERWISFPHCEGADGTLMIAWAGYDHLQLARAISAYYVDIQERLGGRDDPRLVPLLVCLIELLPWLKQWHNDVNPEFGMHMGDYFEGFIQEEARQMGKTLDQITAWEPPKKTARQRKKSAM